MPPAPYSEVQLRPTLMTDLLRAYDRSENKPEGWSEDDANRAVNRYLMFFKLAAKCKDRPHAPTRDIDAIWHLHMLSPSAYYHDCMDAFGEIFDHDGGFGKEPDEFEELKKVFSSTASLWQQEYGEPYVEAGRSADAVTKCWHDCQGRCWHACKSANDAVS